MKKLWRTFAVIPFLALFSQLALGQNIQVAPVTLTESQLFTVTNFGTNIPFPITFNYRGIGGVTITAQSPTTTAVFAFTAGANQSVKVFNPYFYNFIQIAPTPNGPNSAGANVPPITLDQQSVTATLIGNFGYPVDYEVVIVDLPFLPTTVTNGQLQSGTSEFVFNGPQAFVRLKIAASSNAGTLVDMTVTPFVGMTVSPTPIITGAAVTVNVTATANAAASITYRLLSSDGNTASSTTSPAGGTTWQFNAPPAAGVYQLSVLNSHYGLAYTALTVMTPPVIVQPIPGASLLAGSSVTASIFGYDPASSYTLSFVNGIFAYVTTVPGANSRPVLPVPSNYLGQMYLTAAQNGSIDVATYTISVAQAVYNVRGNLRRRAHIGR
jgi:hypothetical protein